MNRSLVSRSVHTGLIIAALAGVAGLLPGSAADLVRAKDGSGVYGYKDTPKLPWCEWLVHDPDRPAPPKVDPGPSLPPVPPPADAIVLFNGSDLSQWTDSTWKVRDGLLVAEGDRSPSTRQKFGSFQLHVEWRGPTNFQGPWYDRGNNGVLLHGLYEIQIFDSFNEPIYPDGQCGAIYAQTPPLVNVTRPPGQWQSFDILFFAPRFKSGKMAAPPRVTVLHNGVLIHHNEVIHGAIGHRVVPDPLRAVPEGPIVLSGHGCPVEFRNLWVRPLDR